MRSRERHTAAAPPLSACAKDNSGVIQSIGDARVNAPKNGEASAAGCTADPTSWRKPGSVSSAVRAAPPEAAAASSTRTS